MRSISNKAMGVQPIRIGPIVAYKRAITPDTASRLAYYLGAEAQSWLNWQAHYDLQWRNKPSKQKSSAMCNR